MSRTEVTRKSSTEGPSSYLLALAFLALAVGVRWALDPWLGEDLPLVTLFAAVAAAVWFGGHRPAIPVALLGFLACNTLFMAPRGVFGLNSAGSWIGLFAYLGSCAVIIGFGEALRRARTRADAERAELLRRERQFSDFFENASVGLHWVGADGIVLRANQAELDLLGYAREEYVGRHIAEFHVERAVIDELLADLAHGETLRERPARLRCKDGSIRDVLIDANALFEDGRLVHSRCITRDVGAQKRAEEEVRRTLTELQATYEQAPVGMLQLDRELRYVRINDGLAAMNGIPVAAHIGKSIHAVVPDLVAKLEPGFRRVLESGEAVREIEVVGQTTAQPGETRTWLESWFPLRDEHGTVVGLNVFAQDVTEKKRAELALRESERRLAAELAAVARMQQVSTRLVQAGSIPTLLDEILDAAIEVTGADMGNLQLLEEGTLRIVSQRGFQAPFLEYFARVHAGQAACGLAATSARRVVVEDVSRSEVFDGSPALGVLLSAGVRAVQSTPLVSRSGRPLGTFSTHYRSPHRPDEAQLRLLDVLARQAADLIERMHAERALREADRRKDEFLATLAHELRNPLAPLRSSLELLKRSGADAAGLARARDTMDRQLTQMERLVEDLLDIARITRNKVELRRRRIELEAVVANALEVCRPLAEDARHELVVALPTGSVLVDGDPVRLAQALGNLLNNACKYTAPGGRIAVVAELDGSEVCLSVKDNGIGIAREMLPRIFDMFTQADGSHGHGLGIGLTLAKQLVELHGGSVEAHSDGLERGSEFRVRLPIVVAESAEPADSGSTLAEPLEPRRVLVVDDNEDGAESLAALLRLSGQETRVAHDGLTALAAADDFRPELVLLDIGLPDLDGFDVCRRMRAQPWSRSARIVALTGWGQDDVRRRSKDAGFDEHLVKPLDYEKLMKLLSASESIGSSGRG